MSDQYLNIILAVTMSPCSIHILGVYFSFNFKMYSPSYVFQNPILHASHC